MVKNQGLFKAFECISSTFQGKFNFQGLFKTVLYIQVLFKTVRTLTYQEPMALALWFQIRFLKSFHVTWTEVILRLSHQKQATYKIWLWGLGENCASI